MNSQKIEQDAAIGTWTIFIAFSRISLSGFGGVLPFLYRAMVDRLKWLNASELAEMLAVGQILPGPTVCNVAVMIGYTKRGLRGAVAAASGMALVPMLIIIVIGIGYSRFGEVPQVRNAVAGMSAVAAGLLAATALRMAHALPRRWQYVVLAVLQFIGIAILQWPLLATIAILVPLAVWVALSRGPPAQPAKDPDAR